MEDLTETWPVGLRFKPREDQLVDQHFRRKLRGETETICLIPELYIYKWEPPDLFARYNALSRIPSDEHECFFFCLRDNKIPNSLRTEFGFWKDTSKKRVVRAPGTGEEIGFKRILVYYEGRKGDARRTDFVMHEYYLNSNVSNSEIPRPMEFVLCRITNRKCEKAGSGSAIMSTRANLTSPTSIVNNSDNEGAQDISAQASLAVTVEPESSNHTTLDYDLPDCNASVPRRPDMLGMESSLCNDNWLVDGTSDEHDVPCSPRDDVIYLSDIWSFN
ncbi:protein NTM1-like 9 [Syzygium oleosum]|uniref:protein NTM1-like 9 n=1 Tax=Syzygium oleosum TaxID=219896 RepID=UPI0011D19268|nr:protein NTM1-like 9 [Syzygium oleosum]